MRLRLIDIAKMANISVGTIDRVIYNRGGVKPSTQKRIEEIVKHYRWTTNPLTRTLKRTHPYCFYTLIPRREQDAGYWQQVYDGIKISEGTLTALGIICEIIEYDRYDNASFSEAADRILHGRPSGVVIPPVLSEVTLPFILELQAEGVPYVFIDAAISDVAPKCRIAQNPSKSGAFAAKMMRLLAGTNDGVFAVLNIYAGDSHLQARRDGFLAACAEKKIDTAVYNYEENKDTGFPVDDVKRFLQSQKNLAGIFVTNSLVCRVAPICRQLFTQKPPVLIGYDFTTDNRALLEDGSITALISQRPQLQGHDALLNLYRIVVLDQDVPSAIEIPVDIYFKENMPPPYNEGFGTGANFPIL